MIDTKEVIEPQLKDLSRANRAFARALNQEASRRFDSGLLEMWGRLTSEAKEKTLLPWRRGEVSGSKLEETRKRFQEDIRQRFENGETRY